MAWSLVQVRDFHGRRGICLVDDAATARLVCGVETTLQLVHLALDEAQSLEQAARARVGDVVALESVALLPPIDHPDPAHLLVSGTGLTHLGSAEGRDQVHRAAKADQSPTDSMKMFLMGLEGGKLIAGQQGMQPEWFYKGDGSILAAPDAPIRSPGFALDAGEEPELAGIYVVDRDGSPVRIGYAIGNEFSDHVTERENYLWLAHSKLRQAALGPELMLGSPPADVRGMSRIRRGDQIVWQKPLLTGEANMSHSLANLEHHHFKYRLFRQPGDIHVHFFGTATLSFSEGIKTEPGDVFEIEAPPFRFPLKNRIEVDAEELVLIRML